ncbi:insulinase family protein [bacterium]|nr:insulinase family protein [bacterium]
MTPTYRGSDPPPVDRAAGAPDNHWLPPAPAGGRSGGIRIMSQIQVRAVLVTAALALVAASALAAGYTDLEDEVQEFTLDNGMRFLVLEDHSVPVFSFSTVVRVGSANEVRGITGISHLLEHMAFKGTSEIGTEDIEAEREAMRREDEAFAALKAERNKGPRADPDRLAELEEAFEEAKDAAREYVVSNQYGEIVEKHGGVGMNAGTWTDYTQYFYSMPSNRLELWAYLEGTRMRDIVLREFYTEKDGPVTEERRMRVDDSPMGKLYLEQFQNLAFDANGYHHSPIGYPADLANMTRADARDYYDLHYIGPNITVAVVGDVEFGDVKKYAREYFADIPGGEPREMETFEPDQLGEKRLVLRQDAQPMLMLGYKIEGINHDDWPVYQAIADILGQGRTSRLHTRAVKEDQKAVQCAAFAGFPGVRYRNLLTVIGIPAKDVTATELEEIVLDEIDRLVTEGPTAEELEGVKRRAKANFVRGLQGNRGLSSQLAMTQAMTGDWRNLFREVADMEAVTLEDIRRVASEIFTEQNRTVAMSEKLES